eukprot:299229-Rhodomonas_salina.1
MRRDRSECSGRVEGIASVEHTEGPRHRDTREREKERERTVVAGCNLDTATYASRLSSCPLPSLTVSSPAAQHVLCATPQPTLPGCESQAPPALPPHLDLVQTWGGSWRAGRSLL